MPVTVLFLVLAVAGIFGFLELPVTLSPDTSFPVAVITAVDPGASPDDLARSVTEPLEDEVSGIMGVHHVMSETAEGIATITVEFQIGTSPDAALEAVRAAVERPFKDWSVRVLPDVAGWTAFSSSWVKDSGSSNTEISGWAPRICSTKVVPLRGVPPKNAN